MPLGAAGRSRSERMFEGWADFYVLIGTAAGALIGLLFVVATLTSGRDAASAARGARLYMTPTVFHFGLVLLISAVALMPAVGTAAASAVVAACAAAGLLYTAVVAVQIRLGKVPEPTHWSDFWWYGAAPVAIYLALAAAAVMIWVVPVDAPDTVAAALIALLLTGIRNAWDLVTFLAPRRPGP
jgi:hypothetical protein